MRFFAYLMIGAVIYSAGCGFTVGYLQRTQQGEKFGYAAAFIWPIALPMAFAFNVGRA